MIAREALLSYRRYYPNSIVLMASSYNPKLIMTQYANKIRCLYCYRSNGNEYDCQMCPAKQGVFFDIERATDSQGSQTPMTNVDLKSFEPAELFFSRLGIDIDCTIINNLKIEIRKEGIEFGTKVYENTVNHVRCELNQAGCDCVDYTLFSKDRNSFLHINQECHMIKNSEAPLLRFASIVEAKQTGRNIICKYCGKKY